MIKRRNEIDISIHVTAHAIHLFCAIVIFNSRTFSRNIFYLWFFDSFNNAVMGFDNNSNYDLIKNV